VLKLVHMLRNALFWVITSRLVGA